MERKWSVELHMWSYEAMARGGVLLHCMIPWCQLVAKASAVTIHPIFLLLNGCILHNFSCHMLSLDVYVYIYTVGKLILKKDTSLMRTHLQGPKLTKTTHFTL